VYLYNPMKTESPIDGLLGKLKYGIFASYTVGIS
jgi:hypothetical protein